MFEVNHVWPGAFLKSSTKDKEAAVERWFISDGTRYQMDFGGSANGWYQFDTHQDAWYYGTWVHPEDLLILSYCEGDITLERYTNLQEYIKAIKKLEKWANQDVDRTYGIDDHDQKHWEKAKTTAKGA